MCLLKGYCSDLVLQFHKVRGIVKAIVKREADFYSPLWAKLQKYWISSYNAANHRFFSILSLPNECLSIFTPSASLS